MSDKVKPKQIGRLTLEAVKSMSSGGNNSYNQVFDKNIQSMDQADAMKTKVLEMPDLNMLDLSYDQIKSLTDKELIRILSGEGHEGFIREPTIQLISNELMMRQIKEASKPHWTVTPTFIVGCIASILAAISILVTIYFSVFYNDEDNNKHTDQSYTIEKNSSPHKSPNN
ncbi:hypothetical protein [Acinetobacter baumannii]|uniref:hypothetical protein n=1 Tax=Acinetobacter baumannii TaxID=470 RepID=UPI0038920846